MIFAWPWLVVGLLYATLTDRLMDCCTEPLYFWYSDISDQRVDLHKRVTEHLREEKDVRPLVDEFMSLLSEEELSLLNEEDFDLKPDYRFLKSGPPVMSLIHGVFLGGLCGLLFGFVEPTYNLGAAQAAFYGVVIGMGLTAFVGVLAIAVVVPTDKSRSWWGRLGERMGYVLSPFLALGAIWYCVKWAMRKRRPDRA